MVLGTSEQPLPFPPMSKPMPMPTTSTRAQLMPTSTPTLSIPRTISIILKQPLQSPSHLKTKGDDVAVTGKCYCCFSEQIIKFNKNGFIQSTDCKPAIFNKSSGAFPGYLPLDKVNTNMKNPRSRSSLTEDITKHTKFVNKVAKYFDFITDATKSILCGQKYNKISE
jgi:hypothetical protein